MQFESANRHKRRKKQQNTSHFLRQKASCHFMKAPRAEDKTGPATLWSNTATCRPQKPKRRKPGRKVIVPAGLSRRGLDGVDAKVKGDARKDQRKEGNLSTAPSPSPPAKPPLDCEPSAEP